MFIYRHWFWKKASTFGGFDFLDRLAMYSKEEEISKQLQWVYDILQDP
jgi:hypothetical protein